MADRIKGISIRIDGNTTPLTNALKQVNSTLRSTQNDLRDVNKMLKLDPGNVQLLEQKQRLLTTAIEETKKKLEQEKQALKEMESAGITDKNQAQYDALQREIVATTEDLKKLTTEMKSFGSVGIQQAAAVGKKFEEVGTKISAVGTKLTTALTLPLTAGLVASGKAASDLNENINKVEAIFGTGSALTTNIESWAKAATDSFGLSESAALEMVAQFGDMGTSMGISEDKMADMAVSLAGLAGDLSSFKNIGVDQAMTALNGVFTGETESLKTLGIVMTETNLKQFASDAGLVYDSMTQAEKVQLRYNYVLAMTKNAQGDYSRTSGEAANSVRTLWASIQNLAAELGNQLLPIVVPIIRKITEMVKKFGSLSDGTKNLIVKLAMVAAAAGPVLTIVGKLTKATGGLIAKVPKLISGVKSFASAASGATTAGSGFASSLGKVAKLIVTNPYAAIAAGAAAAGIAIAALVASQTKIIREYESAKKKREEALSEAATSGAELDLYEQKLESLMSKEEKSAADKELIKTYVDKLNESVEGLNLTYDDEADKLNMTSAALRNKIEEQKKAIIKQAYLNKMQEVANDLVETEIELDEKRAEAKELLAKIQDAYSNGDEATAENLAVQLKDLNNEISQLEDKTSGLNDELEKYSEGASGNLATWSEGFTNLVKQAEAAGIQIPQSLKNAINDGAIEVPESLGELKALLDPEYYALAQQAKQQGITIPEGIRKGLADGTLSVEDACTKLKNGALSKLNMSASAKEIGKQLAAGVAKGIAENQGSAIKAAAAAISSIVSTMKKAGGIHSPSTKTAWLGKMLDAGLAEGIKTDVKLATKAANSAMESTIAAMNNSKITAPKVSTQEQTTAPQTAERAGTIVNQTVNINQPVSTPAETARAMRRAQIINGLAG